MRRWWAASPSRRSAGGPSCGRRVRDNGVADVFVQRGQRKLEDSKTYKRLGYSPISLDERLATTIGWFREIGKLDNRS